MSSVICIDLALNPSPIYVLEDGESWRFLENLGDSLGAEATEIARKAEYCIAVISGKGFLTTRVRLPFSDRKQIDKILPSELADIVPADLDKFMPVVLSVIAEKKLDRSETASKNYFIEVQLSPVDEIRLAIHKLKTVGLDPAFLITPANLMRTLLPQDFNAGLMLVHHGECCYLRHLYSDGTFGAQRIISRARSNRTLQEEGLAQAYTMMTELAGREESLVLYSRGLDPALVQQNSEFVHVDVGEVEPLAVAVAQYIAFYGRGAARLENLRTGEFSYALRLGEIATGLSGIGPYVSSFFLCVVLAFAAVFFIQGQSAADIQMAVNNKVAQSLGVSIKDGGELETLKNKNAILEQELAQIGNPTRLTPLDFWLEVTREIPSIPGVEFKAVRIRGNKLTLEGVSPDYTAIDRIEKALRAKRTTFCRVTQETPGSASQKDGGRQFVLEIRFCE